MAVIKVPKKIDVMLLDGTQGMATGLPFGTDRRVVLIADAEDDTLAQRNGTHSQKFRLYETFIDASNYSRLVMESNGSSFDIRPEAAGTPANQFLRLMSPAGFGMLFLVNNSSQSMELDSSGNLSWGT